MLERRKELPDRRFLLPWIEEEVFASSYAKQARAMFDEVAAIIPEVQELGRTPQGPIFHAEGVVVRDHIERMIAVLLALKEEQNLFFLEEVAREKDLHEEFQELMKTLKENFSFFLAYAFAHDLGKPACLSFNAKPEARGAGEGFIQHGKRVSVIATSPERARYVKLFEDFKARHEGEEERTVTSAFFQEFGIETHYPGHDRVGGSQEFSEARENILEHFSVSLSHAKLFAELIRLHMELIKTFDVSFSGTPYKAFSAVVAKAGLNKERFFHLAAGAIFLDAVVGSLRYEHGKVFHSLTPIINFYKAEKEAEPERHELREEAKKREEKGIVKTILAEGGLAPEEVFALLQTPIGPTRGEIMQKVYALIHEPEEQIDFGEQTEELRRRAKKTQDLFRERDVPFTL